MATSAQVGRVSLVGAGPGDPELLTLKGKARLEAADVVVYDALANPVLLDFAPARAQRIYAGKRSRHHAANQAQIATWMIERARLGLNVVRLKGGDPLIFGRGAEEIEALAAAGIPWEVVPGISAANGLAAAAGIPLTHRELASGVRLTTGYTASRKPETLVVFMGLDHLEAVVAQCINDEGTPPQTAAALVENATLPQQRVVRGTLATIVARARAASVVSPATLVVGAVVGWRERLRSPLAAATTGSVQLPGILLMAHGSPLPGWQAGVDALARALALPGQFSRAAFLAPVEPGLATVTSEAAAAGVERLVVMPYFLAAGLHVTRDIPELVAAARGAHPHLEIVVAECLEGHPALRTAVLARVAECETRRQG